MRVHVFWAPAYIKTDSSMPPRPHPRMCRSTVLSVRPAGCHRPKKNGGWDNLQLFGILRPQPSYQFAVFGVTGNDGRLSRLGFRKCFFLKQQAESPIFLHPTVAGNAMFVNNG